MVRATDRRVERAAFGDDTAMTAGVDAYVQKLLKTGTTVATPTTTTANFSYSAIAKN
jgi:hypothetical protein